MFCRQFLPVQGFELSPIACQDFFREHNLAMSSQPWPDPDLQFMHYQAERIQLWQGDFFQVPDTLVSDSALIYDRAALIALPAEMRQRYATKLKRWLEQGAEMLLITLEYPQQERQGPPFSVPAAELMTLFPDCQLELIDTVDITGQGFGRRRMATSYLLEKIWTIRNKNGA
jgi:thiopurine S-methyltransferase